jgi:hypothetical protein
MSTEAPRPDSGGGGGGAGGGSGAGGFTLLTCSSWVDMMPWLELEIDSTIKPS